MGTICNEIEIADNPRRNRPPGRYYVDTDKIKIEANQNFEKKFQYRQPDDEQNWKIEEQTYFHEFYEFPTLLELEEQLNEEKSKLNDYDIVEWSAHTRKRNPSTEVVWKLKNVTKVEFATVAWCKFYECLHRYSLVKGPKINSVHLCEAPGAFIAALNHYLYSTYNAEEVTWQWFGTTLNPYYEGNTLSHMIADDRFIRGTLDNWFFYEDFSGNIINDNNIAQIVNECAKRLDSSVNLVTADGSVDCWEKPDMQEEIVSLLHWAEITTALSVLANGGCFVLKMFTLFKAASVSKMYLLNCVFDSVHVFKPATSKQGNSEVYIICIGYRKDTPHLADILQLIKSKLKENEESKFQAAIPLFSKSFIPKDFLMQHEVCVRLFMNCQINAIESNIYNYNVRHPSMNHFVHMLRTEVTKQYYERYKIRSLPEKVMILQNQRSNIENNQGLRIHKGSYTDTQNCNDMKVSTMFNDINELEKILNLHTDMNYEMKLENSVVDHDDDDNVQLYHSTKLITSVQSSLFATMSMFLLYKKVMQEYNKNTIWEVDTLCDIDDGLTIASWKDDGKTKFSIAQQQFFENLLDACIEHQPKKLKITNLLVLTHYSASILRYLALYIFDQMNITSTETSVITLRVNEQNSWESRMCKLTNLREMLRDTKLFCVMRLNDLHGNSFSKALIQYNDKQLDRYINMMLTGL